MIVLRDAENLGAVPSGAHQFRGNVLDLYAAVPLRVPLTDERLSPKPGQQGRRDALFDAPVMALAEIPQVCSQLWGDSSEHHRRASHRMQRAPTNSSATPHQETRVARLPSLSGRDAIHSVAGLTRRASG